jgi:tetratricopeptide (TPR) repeat protein
MTFLKYQKNGKQLEDFSSIEWLTTQAVAKHKEGKLEDAIAFYLEVIDLDSHQPAWLYSNAITLMAQIDHLQGGLELGEKALRIHPKSDEIYRMIEILFHQKNDLSNKSVESQKIKQIFDENLDSKSFLTVSEPRETPQDIEDYINLDIASIRRQLMDSAIIEQYQIIFEQMLFDCKKGEKEMNYEALVHCLAEIKTDIHYLKTKLSNSDPEAVDPQAKNNLDLEKIISLPKPIPINCELKERIVGSGWHEAEAHGRWTGPGTLSSVVLPYPATGKYKFEMVVRAEAKADLLQTLKININDQALQASAIQKTNDFFPVIVRGEVIIPQEKAQSFLAIDLIVDETVVPLKTDCRSIGLLVERVSLIPNYTIGN